MTTRVSVSLPDDMVAAIDAVAEEYSLSRSGIMRDVLGQWIDGEDLEQAVEEAIPEATMKLAQKEAREQELMDKQKLREKRHNFEDRVRGYFRKRLEGDAAYPIDGMEELAEGYREDARIWHDDPDELARKLSMVDRFLEFYRMGYFARQHADEIETEVNSEDVDGWFEVGEDIYRLRTHIDDVVDHVRTVGDSSSGYSSEAVVDSVAKRWSVSEGAVLLLLEEMIDPGTATIQEALALGGDRLREDGLDELEAGLEGLALDEPDPHVEAVDDLPDDARLGHQSAEGETVEYTEIESDADDD